ncbi:MAG TPA: hypothetical protein VK533_11185 [Sphingomonas sp.]|uniref:hypothetical protein n=1 Tax=Sphingomonas sp. TaxID=28214 RepID=UPI002BFB38F5|nr:hypothetical protein [Sphingomonas sp.]HMI20098.1 hypothetical protein [Sphingomonas sp.]
MLSRIESAYLGLLRIVILVVATIALLACAITLALSASPILRLTGLTAPPPSDSANLGGFIAEKRIQDTQPAESAASDAPSVPSDLTAAARNFLDYLARQGGPKTDANLKGITDELRQSYAQIPVDVQEGYPASVKSLTEQLLKSKGKQLNPGRLEELVNWHRDRYVADRQEDVTRKLADGIAFFERLKVASGAFIAFIMIVFVFLFVKVERSLRLVRTVRADTDA